MCSARTYHMRLTSPYNLPPRHARHCANAAVKSAIASYTALIFVVLVLVLLVVVATITFGLAPRSLLVVVPLLLLLGLIGVVHVRALLLVAGTVLVPLIFDAAVVVVFFAFFVFPHVFVVIFLCCFR